MRRANRKNTSTRFIIDSDCLPQTIAVIQTPTSISEISAASEPVNEGGAGSSTTTSAPASGRTIRIVVNQLVIWPP